MANKGWCNFGYLSGEAASLTFFAVIIVYHHRTLMDGAEGIHIREMIRAFEDLGHTVVISGPGSVGTGERANRFGRLLKRILPQAGFELATAAYSVHERRLARRLLARSQPEFVYKRHALNDVGMLQAARMVGVPLALEVNVLYSSTSLAQFEPLRFRRLARLTERKSLELADLVVTVSSPLAKAVRDIAPGVKSVLVLPNGADPRRFHPEISGAAVRARFRIPEAATVVGWCGVMRSWHRLELLLEAVRRTGYLLLLIGDGPARRQIEEQVCKLEIAERVRFAGRIAEADVPSHLAAIDIGVVADDLTGYASPMKLLEYMAMAKPVVAPNLPNIRDVVSDGSEGLLFEPGSAAHLARTLSALEDPAARRRLGAQGRKLVEGDRNWRSNARQVLQRLGFRDNDST